MPPAQDNKRLKNNDCGPNTGGMGAVCPYYLDSDDLSFIRTEIFEKALFGMQSRGHPFKGTLKNTYESKLKNSIFKTPDL